MVLEISLSNVPRSAETKAAGWGRDDQATILVVNDNPELLELMSQLLGKAGYRICTATEGQGGFQVALHERPQLVISDVAMPHTDGIELCRLIRADEELRPTPILLVSAVRVDSTSAVEGLQAGADDYLEVPYDSVRLIAKVARLLERGRAEAELERCVMERTAQLEDTYRELEREINERRRAEEAAYYDTLTGLPNRTLFQERLPHALALAERSEQMLAVILLDLDRFKTINETLGQAVGDRLLCEVAERLTGCVRRSDTVARFDGDEFAILLMQITRTEDVARIARRTETAVEVAQSILRVLEAPFVSGQHELYLTASIGIGLCPDDGEDSQTLLKNAGSALYRAKEQGGNNYQFYTADMNAKALKRLALENSLRCALERDEFVLHYQPLVCTNSGQIVGAEALVRWQHPELGLVGPSEFIPFAEDTGLIVPLGEWVLRTACAQNKEWQEMGLPLMCVSVNLSARQFQQPNLSAMIAQVLAETGLAPEQLELELTESSLMCNAETTIETLHQIKGMGIRLAIDDFGTGYSSLSYLKRLPIDVLKIDRSFVCESTTAPDDAAIVMAIIGLAHNLKMKVIAEGVETEEQLAFLRLLRCDEIQGFLCSQPLAAAAFKQFVDGFQITPQLGS
ncbi:MAG: EAL domain-containing protein [Acidobacteria bacterium]|nr:EAL domain-containing protein [Acidobacteriota bacterium]